MTAPNFRLLTVHGGSMYSRTKMTMAKQMQTVKQPVCPARDRMHGGPIYCLSGPDEAELREHIGDIFVPLLVAALRLLLALRLLVGCGCCSAW